MKDICHGAVNYANIIHEKLRQNGYYDDEGQFDITDQVNPNIGNRIEKVLVCLFSKSFCVSSILTTRKTD